MPEEVIIIGTQTVTGDGILQTNVPIEGLGVSNGASSVDRWRGINAIGDNFTFGYGAVGSNLYNGSNWDRQRGNTDAAAALINAVSTTSTQNSSDQTNYNGRGVKVALNVTNIGSGSITIAVQGKDITSGQYYTILTGLVVTANGITTYTIYPGIAGVANASASDILPRTWRVQVIANNANAVTYTVGASTIL